MYSKKKRKIQPCLLFLIMTFALSLISCEKTIDDQEGAAERLASFTKDEIAPSFIENQYRANISLTQTNLLSMLPDLAEYPIGLGEPDSGRTEVVEIFTA